MRRIMVVLSLVAMLAVAAAPASAQVSNGVEDWGDYYGVEDWEDYWLPALWLQSDDVTFEDADWENGELVELGWTGYWDGQLYEAEIEREQLADGSWGPWELDFDRVE